MSPTVFRYKNYRFFFFSREEKRKHVHISSPEGEAKFWFEPVVKLAYHYRLTDVQLKKLQDIVEENKNDINKAWEKHFKS